MRVGIYHVGNNVNYLRLGAVACAVAKTHGYEVSHLTDMDTPAIDGAKVVRRKMTAPMAVFRMQHHQVDGEWLFIDSDVLIHKPVDRVFEHEFSIALAQRKPSDGTNTEGALPLYKEMPYNMGVVFSRSPQFWAEVEKELLTYDANLQHWMGDQLAWCKLIAAKPRLVKLLDCRFNFPPGKNGKLYGAPIVHYKGNRKPMMMDHAYGILSGADVSSTEPAATLPA